MTVDRFADIDCRNGDQLGGLDARIERRENLARNVHLHWTMRGVITSWDVLKNPLVVWRAFGTRCLLRCLSAILRGRSTTFLELAVGKE